MKGNYYWSDPCFTSMIMGGRVVLNATIYPLADPAILIVKRPKSHWTQAICGRQSPPALGNHTSLVKIVKTIDSLYIIWYWQFMTIHMFMMGVVLYILTGSKHLTLFSFNHQFFRLTVSPWKLNSTAGLRLCGHFWCHCAKCLPECHLFLLWVVNPIDPK